MTDFNFSLTAGGFCPIVSECCDKRITADYLLQLQERIERRLKKRVGRRRFQR